MESRIDEDIQNVDFGEPAAAEPATTPEREDGEADPNTHLEDENEGPKLHGRINPQAGLRLPGHIDPYAGRDARYDAQGRRRTGNARKRSNSGRPPWLNDGRRKDPKDKARSEHSQPYPEDYHPDAPWNKSGRSNSPALLAPWQEECGEDVKFSEWKYRRNTKGGWTKEYDAYCDDGQESGRKAKGPNDTPEEDHVSRNPDPFAKFNRIPWSRRTQGSRLGYGSIVDENTGEDPQVISDEDAPNSSKRARSDTPDLQVKGTTDVNEETNRLLQEFGSRTRKLLKIRSIESSLRPTDSKDFVTIL